MTLTKAGRAILKEAHKSGPRTEADLGERLAVAMVLVSKGLLTGTATGLAITDEGARAIGKKLPPVNMTKTTIDNLYALVEPAVALYQQHAIPPTGNAAEDHGNALRLLLVLCVAVGIVAKIIGIPAASCMEAIAVGMKVKVSEGGS